MSFRKNLTFLEGLQQRVSHPRLMEPAPSAQTMQACYQAAFRAPDHAWLRPWRFIECRGNEREVLGELLAASVQADISDIESAQLEKVRKGPLRAPLVLVCYTKVIEHPKVPALEQYLATGAAMTNLINALYAEGYGAVWRTGDPVHSCTLHEGIGLKGEDRIIGLLYVGTPAGEDKPIPPLLQADYVSTLTQYMSATKET